VRASDLRSSYAFDEADILSSIAQASVARLDFDPRDYHWGTLHIELVLLALDAAQAAHAFHVPWRDAYYNLVPGDFDRVYVLGRLVAVAAALFTVWLLWMIPGSAGIFAAMLISVSPSHMLQSDQVRVDVTMTALLVLTLLAAMRTQTNRSARQFFLLGIAGGLAIAAKYSAVTAVAAIALAALILQRLPWRGVLACLAGSITGIVTGGPYIAIKPRAFYDPVALTFHNTAATPAEFVIPAAQLIALHGAGLVRFSMGLPAVLLAAAGLILMWRRRSASDWMVLSGIAGYVAILFVLRWPLIRYDLPLIALLGIAAGVALSGFSKPGRYPLWAISLIVPLTGSIAQIHYMREPPPANVMLARILETAPSGAPIARLVAQEPPLDQHVYPRGQNVLMDDLTKNPPDWVLTTSLPDHAYKVSNLALLQSQYEEVARVEPDWTLPWATFGETGAPQDRKYTHPSFTLYRKKAPSTPNESR
jgi:hypothetical protein